MDNKFFDAHFHAYNLSHPNLSAFLDRFFSKDKSKNEEEDTDDDNPDKDKSLYGAISSLFKLRTDALNVLSIMDNDCGNYFLNIDYYLMNAGKGYKFPEMTDYQKIVLVPLVVDFTVNRKQFDKKFEKKVFYKLPPQKPVDAQISDLFKGIKFYYENDLQVISKIVNKKTIYDINHININDTGETLENAKNRKRFEIYPFLGLNTLHYNLKELKADLEKYFYNYNSLNTKQKDLYQKFYDKLGTFDGNLNKENYDYNFIFSGIKVYPPLGFDPWPLDAKEKAKVEHLYKICSEKGIPVTTHCSSGGFKSVFDNKKLTNPKKWEQVLQTYPKLKLNLAHMGYSKESWKNKVIDLICNKSYPNVYTDFSDFGHSQHFYNSLRRKMNNNAVMKEKVMFGSDFMINLFESNSYNDYLKKFFASKLSQVVKDKLCNKNPLIFLFGK